MADCNSDPTDGCTQESQIVAAINVCCATQTAQLVAQNVTLTEIKTATEECCTEMNANLSQMVSLLTLIEAKI